MNLSANHTFSSILHNRYGIWKPLGPVVVSLLCLECHGLRALASKSHTSIDSLSSYYLHPTNLALKCLAGGKFEQDL